MSDAVSARISVERVIRATGHDWAHWFGVLDGFGCSDRGHKASAQHLHDDHGVGAWWSQSITIEYEVANGIREPSQRSDGKFGLSVQRTVAAPVERCWESFTTAAGLNAWFTSNARVDFRVGGLYTSPGGDRCKFKRIDRHSFIRMTWEHPKHSPGSIVEVGFDAKGDSTTVGVSHTRIASKEETDDLKKAWSGVMDDFRAAVEA